MSDHAGNFAFATSDPVVAAFVAFTVTGEHFALPMLSVEAVMPPPRLARLPRAVPGLLGVANLAGRVLPIVDAAHLLGRQQIGRRYDGGGEIVLLRTPDGRAGLWVDRVERLLYAEPGGAAPPGVVVVDASPLLRDVLSPRETDAGAPAPLGAVADLAPPATVAVSAEAVVLFEVSGLPFWVAREAVAELLESVPWIRVPGAPAGLLGVAVLRGAALPVLSAAALLELPEHQANGFVMVEIDGRGALLAVDRVVGLRRAAAGRPIAVAATLSAALRQIVLGFSPVGAGNRAAAPAAEAGQYLAFSVGGQDFAVPAAVVDRIAAAPRLAVLPRPANTDDATRARVIGIIELAGQIVPVAALRSRLSAADDAELHGKPASVYVVLRTSEGLGAIGVDAVRQVVSLARDEIAPRAAAGGLIEAVATTAGGSVLRLLSTARLWEAA